ncbi:MAG: hypothetical protein ACON35_01845, partial [Candidatus Marinamargulisbacteria bacterium]
MVRINPYSSHSRAILTGGKTVQGHLVNPLWRDTQAVQNKLKITKEDFVNEFNNAFKGRAGHQPITLEEFNKVKDQWKPELMTYNAICPAMAQLLKKACPVMGHQIEAMGCLLDQFNSQTWMQDGTPPKLTELADFYFTDNWNQDIKSQLKLIDPSQVTQKDGTLSVTLTSGEEETYSAATKFLTQVLKGAVDITFVPRDLGVLQKEISDKIDALITDGHGVDVSVIGNKIAAIEYEMNVIKAANPAVFEKKESEENFRTTTQVYRYQVLQDRLARLEVLKKRIEGKTQQLKAAVKNPSELFGLLGIQIDTQSNTQEGSDEGVWAQLLHQNMGEINKQLESHLANQYDEVWENIAAELAGSVTEEDIKDVRVDSLDSDDEIKNVVIKKIAAEDIEAAFKKRWLNWSRDVSLLSIRNNIVPETAFLLWGRHAGVDKQTIMNLWGDVDPKTPKGLVISLKDYCKDHLQLTPGMNHKLNGLQHQLEEIERPTADIPHIKTRGVEDKLNNVVKTTGEIKGKKAEEIQRRVRGVIAERSNRTDLLKKQFTLKPTMTLQECFAPFVRPGHDGQPEVKEILFKGPFKALESTNKEDMKAKIKALNKTMKAAIEKLIQGETIEGELKSLNEAFNNACESSAISPHVKEVEKMKIDYVKQLNAMVEANDTQEANSIQRTDAATITLNRGEEISDVALKRQNEGTGLDLPDANEDLAAIIEALKGLPENNAKQTQAILYGRAMAKLENYNENDKATKLADLCNAVMKNHNDPGQTLPIPVTFHQDLRACLKKMEPQEIRTFLTKIEDNNGADVIEALFHPPGAMDSLLKGDAPAILQENYTKLGTAIFEAYQFMPELLMAHLDGNKGSAEQENSFREGWGVKFVNMFPTGREWSYDEQQTLLAATMTWPPAIREALQGLEGVFSGAKGHVMDTVC